MGYRVAGYWDTTRLTGRSEQGEELASPVVPPGELVGRTVDAATGHPVNDVGIIAELDVNPRAIVGRGGFTTGARDERTVASVVTDSRGRFRIDLSAAMRARPELGQLGSGERVSLQLSLRSRGTATLREGESREPAAPLVLLVEREREPFSERDWAEMAQRLADRKCVEVREVVAELVGVDPGRHLFREWSADRRHSALHALELAFLDPAGVLSRHAEPPTFFQYRTPGAWNEYLGRLRSLRRDEHVQEGLTQLREKLRDFSSLHEVDWVLELGRLNEGLVAEALEIGRPSRALAHEGGPDDSAFKPGLLHQLGDVHKLLFDSKLVAYRDYLRAIFTGPPSLQNSDYAPRLADLERRFHQDFTNARTGERPAAEVLVGIVGDILTAPTGQGYGLGLSELPAQEEQSDAEYLQTLIELSGHSSREFQRRYRLDLERPVDATTSPVQLNIDTLQAFYRDGFQSDADPHPIFPAHRLGKAPFFLYYEEWQLRNRPFFPENYFPLKKSFSARVGSKYRELAVQACEYEFGSGYAPGKADNRWFIKMMAAEDALDAGQDYLRKGQLNLARESFTEALELGKRALNDSASSLAAGQSDRWLGLNHWGSVINHIIGEVAGRAQYTRSIEPTDPASLEDLVTSMVSELGYYPVSGSQHDFRDWLNARLPIHQFALVRLCLFVAPCCLGDTAMEAGDYEGAIDWYEWSTRFLTARTDLREDAGYRSLVYPYNALGPHDASGRLYVDGSMPYSADVSGGDDSPWPPTISNAPTELWDKYNVAALHAAVIHPVEERHYRLRHAGALLSWADALYRSDEPAKLQRARELYKAVMFLHRRDPGISPGWGYFEFKLRFNENPALAGQVRQARQGIFQIDEGLNFLGLDDSLVPALRYSVLKDAADRLVSAAQLMQEEMITALDAIEESLEGRIVNTSMLEKARLQAKIAMEQREIAEAGVALAADQVEQVNKTIAAKEKELEDSGGFFRVLGDFFGGIVTALKDIAFISKPVGTEAKKVAGFSDGKVWLTQKAASGATTPGAAAGLGTAGTVFAGYALFIYAGYTSASAMSDATTSLRKEIRDLKNRVLPLAKKQLGAAESQVRIAQLQRAIAQLDAQLALDLLHFQGARFLNEEFWSQLLAISKRALQRYLFLAGRYAWLAERALAYEQGRSLNIVRFDYFPENLQGISGATALHSDLAELELARLGGLRPLKPVSRVYSLAFDFPLHFAMLKRDGWCRFWTRDADLRDAYPGTYGHRVQGASIGLQTRSGATPFHGQLSNPGFSSFVDASGERKELIRPFDAMPISGYDRHNDATSFGLPGETLDSFEGSGVDTLWQLEFPARANPFGLDDLMDVILRLDIRCYHDMKLQLEQAPSGDVNRTLLLSAARFWPREIIKLQGDSLIVTLDFAFADLQLPPAEQNRVLENLALMVIGRDDLDGPATLGPSQLANTTGFQFEKSVALSNAPPLADPDNPPPPEPLNAVLGSPLEQVFSLTIDKNDFPGTDFSDIQDVVIALAYRATL